ncbi:hypothetical protein PQR33_28105 [Paraburkholderia sediminicola]|uniref:hypothetical protein n=1 Tax=Paraburkholderia sediminicola TaxID=458836 RepID=UPI0038B9107B
MYVAFSDATEAVISSVFSCAQDDSAHPFQGSVTASDPRYATFYNQFPPAMQEFMEQPAAQS